MEEVLVRMVGVYVVHDDHDRQAATCVIASEIIFISFVRTFTDLQGLEQRN